MLTSDAQLALRFVLELDTCDLNLNKTKCQPSSINSVDFFDSMTFNESLHSIYPMEVFLAVKIAEKDVFKNYHLLWSGTYILANKFSRIERLNSCLITAIRRG